MSLTQKNIFYENNFNLIRLFAAAQVVHFHLVSIYELSVTSIHSALLAFLGFFPGVPIFFFISGFLISKSWESSRSWQDYAVKRLARIEPALIVSVLFALALVFASGYMRGLPSSVSFIDIAFLLIAKITVLQFYNPDYLRAYGDGVLNGSLWTIIVEIQFYVLIPMCYVLLKLNSGKVKQLVGLIFLFVLANACYDFFHEGYADTLAMKLAKVTFFPWFFMFLVGVFFQKNFLLLHKYLSGKFLLLLILYVGCCLLGIAFGFDLGNSLNPFLFMVLACLIFSAAYSNTLLAETLLGKLDISYGLYLYHMPIINYFLYLNYGKTYLVALIIAILAISTSIISWYLVESPSLRYAKKWHKG